MTNRGVDALVASKAAALREIFPGCQIDVLTADGTVNRPFLEMRDLGCIEDLFQSWRYNLELRSGVFRPIVRTITGGATKDLERRILSYDLAIATGGDNFSSDYGSPRKYLRPLEILADAGVPVAMIGQSIGPFRDDGHRADFVKVAKKMRLITARESATFKYLIDELGLPADRIFQTADTAFLLNPALPELADKMARSFGLANDQPTIALSVSGGIAGFASGNASRHLDALERMSRRLLSETPAQLLLIPHVEDHDPSNNDMIVADQLLRRLDFDPRVRLAKGFLTSNEYKAIVARCDMVIAERMHVAIAGLSSGLATFVVGYSVKGHGIMSDCFGQDAQKAGLVVSLQDFVDDKTSDDKIIKVWTDRKALSSIIRERLPSIVELARKNFSLVRALFPSNDIGIGHK
jgi:colanic acid/amylovoran biosynthesis protein